MSTKSLIFGDKVLLVIVLLLSLFSFFPVFSSSSYLSYVIDGSSPIYYLVKHLIVILFGFVLMLSIKLVPFKFFRGMSIILLPIGIGLLVYTLSQGTIIGGSVASRWIDIPFVGISFQTSALAAIIIITYTARYLSKVELSKTKFSETLIPLWLPIFTYIFLIFPANFSSAFLIFTALVITLLISGFPLRHLFKVFLILSFLLITFFFTAKTFPDKFPNRIDTWLSRIENFGSNKNLDASYQIERAKMAINNGGLIGVGAGKSIMKNHLPQSNSDFIFAIIVEEWGALGGAFIISLYILMFFRFLSITHRIDDRFGKILVSGLGVFIIIQAFTNISVATQIIPVTGQNLPLISSGGSSAWMTCISLGMILSVSSSIKNKNGKQ
jgi:cell division protein FtsW